MADRIFSKHPANIRAEISRNNAIRAGRYITRESGRYRPMNPSYVRARRIAAAQAARQNAIAAAVKRMRAERQRARLGRIKAGMARSIARAVRSGGKSSSSAGGRTDG